MKGKRLLPVLLLCGLILAACRATSPRPAAQTPAPSSTPAQSITEAATEPAATEPAATPAQDATEAQQPLSQPVAIDGGFQFTNDIVAVYYDEHMVALVDMYGFITRDLEWEMPVESQTLGFLDMDEETLSATYNLQLPARPTGTLADVDQDGEEDTGVQVFAVSYWPNLTGGPYSEGDDPSRGWPTYLSSNKVDTENKDEVTGGKLVIWAPDDQQSFPSDFGEDGLLFTGDDPAMDVPQGYSVIDLDQKPFAILRDEVPEVTLYEPNDIVIKDFSELPYDEAFDQMFEIVRKEYAFNGIEGKEPDWDSLYAELSPRVQEAVQNQDTEAFFLVMRDFVEAFNDGHVGMGSPVGSQLIGEQIAGGYGFAVRELDDGRVMVVYVLEGSPAAEAGMQRGAVITEFNGQPIDEAIGAVEPPTAPHSTEFSRRYQQARYLLRAPVGTQASVTFTNPGGTSQTAELEAVGERQSLSYTSTFRGFDPNALPVESTILPPGIGYIKLSSNLDDLGLIVRLFERALKTFEDNQLQTVILDLRQNSGGAPLGLAGYLTDQEIVLGQKEYFSEATGQFEPEGLPEKVTPYEKQFRFDKVYLLVDQACASACEIEAYGFSQVPGVTVVGQFPSAGVEAEVARGQFLLPDETSLQIPTGRFVLPDGSLFLEGQGVEPTVRIPITEELVLAEGDPVLSYVIELAQQ